MTKERTHLWDIVSLVFALTTAYLMSEYNGLQKGLVHEASLLNNTVRSNQSVLIFNRNPKSGSETLWGLLDKLALLHGFKSFSDSAEAKKNRGSENCYLSLYEERKHYVGLFDGVDDEGINMTLPFSYVKHLNFLNFEEFNKTNPIYVNIVRHPLDRVISWYYYIRQNWYQITWDDRTNSTALKSRILPTGRFKMSYEECFTQKLPECTYPVGGRTQKGQYGGSHFSQIAFFCGMDPECDEFGSEAGLRIAKSNVEKYYAVVGILEKWKESLQVLESYVPAFFKDVRKVYKKYMDEKPKNANKFKPKVPKYIKEQMAKNFTAEFEFYEFCKQRFYKQLLAIS